MRGYKEEGTSTTPFDMLVRNDLDRFHLVIDATKRVPKLKKIAKSSKRMLLGKLLQHKTYIRQYGEDMVEIRNWSWQS